MKSLYKAKIFHKRFLPRVNKFAYSGFYIRFSLEKIKELDSLLFSVNKFNLFSFYEKDHGYKDGSYQKIWNGREDNEYLVEIIDSLDPNQAKFKDQVYIALKSSYPA